MFSPRVSVNGWLDHLKIRGPAETTNGCFGPLEGAAASGAARPPRRRPGQRPFEHLRDPAPNIVRLPADLPVSLAKTASRSTDETLLQSTPTEALSPNGVESERVDLRHPWR